MDYDVKVLFELYDERIIILTRENITLKAEIRMLKELLATQDKERGEANVSSQDNPV